MPELKRPVISIVGRPNVGKSTLFNKLAGKRKAIVQNEPGVTRDRNEALCRYRDRQFTLIDTGGLLLHSKDALTEQVRRQSEVAIEQSDRILFILDAREGMTPVDLEVHDLLRRSGKPIYYVINKTEGKGGEGFNEFYELGVTPLYAVSAEHNLGLSDLLDALYPHLSPAEEERVVESPKVVVLGRPNVGKSTLINAVLKENRLVTSDIPGTTRDTIDTWVLHEERRYLFIDTAGIRKRGKVAHGVEQYSVARAKNALERADVALLVLDGAEGVTEQDTKIAGMISEGGRGAVLLVNKSDLLGKEEKKAFEIRLSARFPFIHDLQVTFISALEGRGLGPVFEKVDAVYRGLNTRVTTGDLNRFFEKVIESHPPPIYKGRPIRLYYITQASVRPPTFILFASAPAGVPDHYLRYLENQLRAAFGFTGAPIRIKLRQRK